MDKYEKKFICVLFIFLIVLLAECIGQTSNNPDPYKSDKSKKISAKTALSLIENHFSNNSTYQIIFSSLQSIYGSGMCAYSAPNAGNCSDWFIVYQMIIERNSTYYYRETDKEVSYNKDNHIIYSVDIQTELEVPSQNISSLISSYNNSSLDNKWSLDSYQAYQFAEKKLSPDKYDHNKYYISKVLVGLDNEHQEKKSSRWYFQWVYRCINVLGECGTSKEISVDANTGGIIQ